MGEAIRSGASPAAKATTYVIAHPVSVG